MNNNSIDHFPAVHREQSSDESRARVIPIGQSTIDTIQRQLNMIRQRSAQPLGKATLSSLDTIRDTSLTNSEEVAGHTEENHGAPVAIDSFADKHPDSDEPTSSQ